MEQQNHSIIKFDGVAQEDGIIWAKYTETFAEVTGEPLKPVPVRDDDFSDFEI